MKRADLAFNRTGVAGQANPFSFGVKTLMATHLTWDKNRVSEAKKTTAVTISWKPDF